LRYTLNVVQQSAKQEGVVPALNPYWTHACFICSFALGSLPSTSTNSGKGLSQRIAQPK
jgi:hypothetical protein